MKAALRASWATGLRSARAVLRRPVLLSFSFLQPLIWMTFFGFLFERAVSPAQLGAPNYLSFVAPGVSLMSVLFGASQAGVPLVRDAQTGVLARLLGTRTPAAQWLLGKLVADVLRLLAVAFGVLLLAAALGAEFAPKLQAAPAALAALLALAWALSSLSCALAAWARVPEALGTYVHLINMPLLFTSTALVPQRALPGWLAALARFNPLSLAVEHWRALWLGQGAPSALWGLGTWALACFGLAVWALDRARVRA